MDVARNTHSLTLTPRGASNNVQTFAMTARGAQALNTPMASKSMARVAPTQALTATSRRTRTKRDTSAVSKEMNNVHLYITLHDKFTSAAMSSASMTTSRTTSSGKAGRESSLTL